MAPLPDRMPSTRRWPQVPPLPVSAVVPHVRNTLRHPPSLRLLLNSKPQL